MCWDADRCDRHRCHAVKKLLRAGKPGARFDTDMLFQNREFGSDAPAFAIIGLLGKSIGRTKNIAAQPQAAIAISAVVTRGLGLYPVQKRKAELPRFFQRDDSFFVRNSDHRLEPVVHLRPVCQRDIAAIDARHEVSAIGDAPRMPEIEQIFRIAVACEKAALQRFVGHMIADSPVELKRRPKIELQLAEFVVQSRPVNGMIFVRP